MFGSVAAVSKTLYRALPRGRKRALRRFMWTMAMRNPDRRRLFLRLTASSPAGAYEAAGQTTDPVVRDICRAHGAYRSHDWDSVVDLLTPHMDAEPLGLDDYAILVRSLVALGRMAEARRPFAKACSQARRRGRSPTEQAEVAELAIGLDDEDAAVEFSEGSGSAWLAQYVAVVYGTGTPVVHEALRDRLPARVPAHPARSRWPSWTTAGPRNGRSSRTWETICRRSRSCVTWRASMPPARFGATTV